MRDKNDVQLTMSQMMETTLLMSLTSQRPSPMATRANLYCIEITARAQLVDAMRGQYDIEKDSVGTASIVRRANGILSRLDDAILSCMLQRNS